jgi:hypothetical protein
MGALSSCVEVVKSSYEDPGELPTIATFEVALEGGSFIYSKESLRGDTFFQNLGSEIENYSNRFIAGDWRVFFTGWTGADPLMGSLFCGHSRVKGKKGVTFVMDKMMKFNCEHELFFDDEYYDDDGVFQLSIVNCEDLSKVDPSLKNCDSAMGSAESLRISFGVTRIGNFQGISSECILLEDAQSVTDLPTSLPTGSDKYNNYTVVFEAFDDDDCKTIPKTIILPKGLRDGLAGEAQLEADSVNKKALLYLKTNS